jgi:hypothetical protein
MLQEASVAHSVAAVRCSRQMLEEAIRTVCRKLERAEEGPGLAPLQETILCAAAAA